MNERYGHLGLTRWPFPVVPYPEFCTFLADRRRLREEVEELLRFLSRRETSSIHLFWSWFGAGKTHTLFYLANRASVLNSQPGTASLQCVYSEFPKAPNGFMDLYRTFISGLDLDDIVGLYEEVITSPTAGEFQKALRRTSAGLASVLHVLLTGDEPSRMTATRWIRGERLLVSECRSIGASQRLGSAEEGARVLADLQRLFSKAAESRRRPGSRLIWILDEYQRVESLPRRVRDEINTSLHSLFNACPTGLSLLLSFSGEPSKGHAPPWLTPELASRMGRTKVMTLPPLQRTEAIAFVREVLGQFRPPTFEGGNEYFPFTQTACEAIIDDVRKSGELKPRDIMSAFNAVLQEADPKIESREMGEVSASLARRILASYVDMAVADGAERE